MNYLIIIIWVVLAPETQGQECEHAAKLYEAL